MMKQNKGTEDLRNFYEEKNGWIFIFAKNILLFFFSFDALYILTESCRALE